MVSNERWMAKKFAERDPHLKRSSGNRIPDEYGYGQLNQYTPEQRELFQQNLGMVDKKSYLSRLARGKESAYQEMEAPAYRQFQEGLGGLSSRFSAGSGRGSLGTRRSSGFQNSTTAAYSNFAQQLQANRMQLRNEATRDLLSMSDRLLEKRPTEKYLVDYSGKGGGALGGYGGMIGTIGGAAVGGYFGNAPGAVTGAQIGGNAFQGL